MPDDDYREKLSWSEIDKLREKPGERRPSGPRGQAAQARSRQATQRYLKQLDNLFAGDAAGAEGEELAKAVRDAHGTADLADACRAYRDAAGMPEDPGLLSLFLDARDRELVLEALGKLASLGADAISGSRGLRSQLQILADDVDDDLAIAAEDVLRALP